MDGHKSDMDGHKIDMEEHKRKMRLVITTDTLKKGPWPYDWKQNERPKGLLKYKEALSYKASPLKGQGSQ